MTTQNLFDTKTTIESETPKLQKLEFSHNWNNKLSCQNFTTLRLSSRFEVGNLIEIWFKDKFLGLGRVVDKKRLVGDQLNDWICRLDTGYNREETLEILRKMYKGVVIEKAIIYYYLIEKTR